MGLHLIRYIFNDIAMNDTLLPKLAAADLSGPIPNLWSRPFPTVSLDGALRQPGPIGRHELEALGVGNIPTFLVTCVLDGEHGGPRRLRGTPLKRVLYAAEPAFDQETDFKHTIILAHGADGYHALYSWAELANTLIGDGLYVVFDCEAAPMPAGSGPFALISLHDRLTGPRHVQNLVRLEVRTITP